MEAIYKTPNFDIILDLSVNLTIKYQMGNHQTSSLGIIIDLNFDALNV